jgi:branched-chain amino acid transport system permease protein
VLGMVYALLAVGFTMVYGVLNMMNFVHGEVYMFGAFASWGVLTIGLKSPLLSAHPVVLILPLMIAASVLMAAIVVLVVERICFRPLRARKAGRLSPIISAVGASLALQQLMIIIQNTLIGNVRVRVFEWWKVIPRTLSWEMGGIHLTAVMIIIVGLTLLVMVATGHFVANTKYGRAMRAAAQDPDVAQAMGINLKMIIVQTFLIGATLAGLGGVFIGFYFGQIDTAMGFPAMIKAFIAAVIGGIGSIRGAVVGGVVLGIFEGISTTYVGTNYKDVLTFVLLILLLMVRPRGLMGQQVDVYERT